MLYSLFQSKLEKLNEQLEAKHRDITKLHESEKALTAAFLTSLGENNKFEEFLTKVFKKKIKRVKKKAKPVEEGDGFYSTIVKVFVGALTVCVTEA